MSMPLRRGTHAPLEEAADALLKESLRGVTRHSDKSDLLTPWKEQERRRREVYVPSGTPDSANRAGIFHRVINPTSPHLNSRGSTTVRARRITATPDPGSAAGGSSFGDTLAPGAPVFLSARWDEE